MRHVTLLLATFFTLASFAQAPQAINYQAVARDASGEPLVNQQITPRFTIHQTTATGTVVYDEDHASPAPVVITDNRGLFNVRIGEGYALQGTFANIDWSAGPYFLEVGLDTAGGLNYVSMGTQQLVSVPFAQYAETAGSATSDGDWEQVGGALHSDGKWVGIGTTSPLVPLHVIGGDIRVQFVTLGKGMNSGYLNLAAGLGALSTVGSGNQNTAVGGGALSDNTTGWSNTAIGTSTLLKNISGGSNTAVGSFSMVNSTTGGNNTALGAETLYSNTSGTDNVCTGHLALYSNTTGRYNVAVGKSAMHANQIGFYRTALGYFSNTVAGPYNNNTGIGYFGSPTASDQVKLGNTSVTSIGGQVSYTTFSDQRFKTDVRDDEVKGLEFIKELRPLTYRYDIRSYADWFYSTYGVRDSSEWDSKYDIEQMRFTGFMAQEVEAAAAKIGYDFSGVDKPESEKDTYGLRYAEFVVPLVKGMQEQQAMIDEQDRTIADLNASNAEMRADMEAAIQRMETLAKQMAAR